MSVISVSSFEDRRDNMSSVSDDYCCHNDNDGGSLKRKLSSYLQDYCNMIEGREEEEEEHESARKRLYANFYDNSTIIRPIYGDFDSREKLPVFEIGEYAHKYAQRLSIPALASFFDVFDPINLTRKIKRCGDEEEKWVGDRDNHSVLGKRNLEVNEAAFEHLAIHLLSRDFNRDLLCERKHDAMAHAIVSYALFWSISSLERFAEEHPRCAQFARIIEEETIAKNAEYVYEHRPTGIPFVRTTFKIIRRVLEENEEADADAAAATEDENDNCTEQPLAKSQMPVFALADKISNSFVRSMSNIYEALREEKFDYEMLKRTLERDDPIPYNIQHEIGNYVDLKAGATLKFVTGQACCGKTTLLNAMRRKGWKIVSRGSIGSFSGKASNPVAVACLHASIDWALRHDNVLGDRGHIDNPLWVGIMQLCDPAYSETLVRDLFAFINDNFNAATVGFFIAQKGVVFIDPYPSKCSARMLRRCTNGDAFRARIATYAIVQTMAYLIVAKLFGWRVYCVPYDARGNFDPSKYAVTIEEMHEYFGPVGTTNPIPREHYGKPLGLSVPDFTYPKSVGIFK